ncbi:MAG: radical SAM family heme chaperone HemW [Alphaproteobacteria bacterium]|nr:radical SAM family heme chaperone HemW [Alphaproteobacteria bacterium]
MIDELGVYFHWPYCRSKCPYCDFFSRVAENVNQDEIIAGYLQQLTRAAQTLGRRCIKSVFFGGGTPSLISPDNIKRLLDKINDLWSIQDDVEITLEANPNSYYPQMFANLAAAGINRLSLGVQSLDDAELRFLGRTHSAAQALAAIAEIKDCFANHSIDLIYALPKQNIATWSEMLEQIIALGLRHISLYQLTIEEGTVFAAKKIRPLAEEKAVALYRRTERLLSAAGYAKYEVSNYASAGYACVHNQIYWQGGDYLGIGPSAHGRLQIDGKIYAQTDGFALEELSPQERAIELIIMGLRLVSGINRTAFRQGCGLQLDEFINQDFCRQMQQKGLLSDDGTALCATPDGFLLLDYLISGLVP